MSWTDYWTMIIQVVLACVIFAFPVGIFCFFVSSAISTGAHRREESKKQDQEVISGGR